MSAALQEREKIQQNAHKSNPRRSSTH
uniref:Uncharacterized protein n=1 Tax=Arundo donax TaxID=35708 RepID=A0A0A9GRU4_ARUDO